MLSILTEIPLYQSVSLYFSYIKEKKQQVSILPLV